MADDGNQLAGVINVRDASEEVFAIPEIMSNIYRFLDRKNDLLSCTLLCKAGRPVAEREMFREMRVLDFDQIIETGCSFKTLDNYAKLVETIHMPGANIKTRVRPLKEDVEDIVDRYPNVKCVMWSPTIKKRDFVLSEIVWLCPSDADWNQFSAVLSIAVPSTSSEVLKETLERGDNIYVRVAEESEPEHCLDLPPYDMELVELVCIGGTRNLYPDHYSEDHRFSESLFGSDECYQQLRRLCIDLYLGDDGRVLRSLRSLGSLPQLQDLTITGRMGADQLSLRWLAMLPTTPAKIRVTAKLACPAEHLLELTLRDHPRIQHLELDCVFPERHYCHYCQYRIVRFLGLIAKRTTISIPLVCERTHVERLFSLRAALALQEEEEHRLRGPFEKYVQLMPKETVVVKEGSTKS